MPKCSDLHSKSTIIVKLANYSRLNKNYKQAELYALQAIEMAEKIKLYNVIKDASETLYQCYKHNDDYKNAYKYLLQFLNLQNKLNNDDVKKSIVQSKFKLEFDKKEIEIKAEQSKKDVIRKTEKQKQQLYLALAIVALLATGVVLFFVNKNYKSKIKTTKILETQNNIIQEQKQLVEQKNNEIVQSINYAKRIQSAMLTDLKTWNSISTDYFIYYLPKDIVSGDFYWAYITPSNLSIILLADCTGHGVPGSMMSMLGNTLINEIVVDNKIYKPEEILNILRKKIKNILNRNEGQQQQDGMDVAVITIDAKKENLLFAGANNNLWIVRNDELLETKGDKMPVGAYINDTLPFTLQKIALQKNDCIYLATDGYADQFGGKNGKKFKYQPLKNLLIANSKLNMTEQKSNIQNTLNHWKNDLEQVDDISIIGLRV